MDRMLESSIGVRGIRKPDSAKRAFEDSCLVIEDWPFDIYIYIYIYGGRRRGW